MEPDFTKEIRAGDVLTVHETGRKYFVDQNGNINEMRRDLDSYQEKWDEDQLNDSQQRVDWEKVLNASSSLDDSWGSAAFTNSHSKPLATSTPTHSNGRELTQQQRCTPPIPWQASNSYSGTKQGGYWQSALVWVTTPHILLPDLSTFSPEHTSGPHSPPPLSWGPPEPHSGLLRPVPSHAEPSTSHATMELQDRTLRLRENSRSEMSSFNLSDL